MGKYTVFTLFFKPTELHLHHDILDIKIYILLDKNGEILIPQD